MMRKRGREWIRPAGGQGLNLGVCDGVVLGRAIVDALDRPGEEQELFAEYERKRRAVAREVIHSLSLFYNMYHCISHLLHTRVLYISI